MTLLRPASSNVIRFDNFVIRISPYGGLAASVILWQREIMFHVKHYFSFKMKGIVLSAKEPAIWVKIESFKVG